MISYHLGRDNFRFISRRKDHGDVLLVVVCAHMRQSGIRTNQSPNSRLSHMRADHYFCYIITIYIYIFFFFFIQLKNSVLTQDDHMRKRRTTEERRRMLSRCAGLKNSSVAAIG